MSIEIESRLKVLLASVPRDIHAINTLEISHSALSQTYYFWREPRIDNITTEDGVRVVQPVNFDIKPASDEGDLDQKFEIRIDTVDIEDEFREQMDLIPVNTAEKIICVYRVYISDDLTDVVARYALQVEEISYEIGAASITAVAPRLNSTRTGELFTTRDVPMLRAYL